LNESLNSAVDEAAMAALNKWKAKVGEEEEKSAEIRFDAIKNQIRDLQYNLDEEQQKMNLDFPKEEMALTRLMTSSVAAQESDDDTVGHCIEIIVLELSFASWSTIDSDFVEERGRKQP
jgi:hypothetical protein